jgi:DNA-binding PadR family transcriptional regulator
MLSRVILGLLRDGRSRHGYELMAGYRTRSGLQVNAGNFYRELNKLAGQGLIHSDVNPPNADPRRVPYRIADEGTREFDAWLLEPGGPHADFSSWLIFVDMLSIEDRHRILDGLKEELWLLSKALLRARRDALARAKRNGSGAFHAASIVLLRRIKQNSADLEFLDELRQEIETIPPGPVIVREAT